MPPFGRQRSITMGKLIVVAGLGLEGGSMAKALKKYTDHRVWGWNRTRSVAEKALADGAREGGLKF